jgi:hypothetical protein
MSSTGLTAIRMRGACAGEDVTPHSRDVISPELICVSVKAKYFRTEGLTRFRIISLSENQQKSANPP